VFQSVVAPDAQDRIAKRSHDFIPPAVIGAAGMLRAIELDDEPFLSATEIGEIWANGVLADEMVATKFFRLEFQPKKSLGLVFAMS
jgi:hypothetical protein